MIFLIGSILTSALFGIYFKWIGKLNKHALTIIIINYFTASIFGFCFSNDAFAITHFAQFNWFWVGITLGIFFIISLYAIAQTSIKVGVSVAQVVNKMSMVIPILASLVLFNNTLNLFSVLGILLALVAIYFVTRTDNENVNSKQKKNILFPIVIFICSGIIDTTLNYTQIKLLQNFDSSSFISTIFLSAGAIGLFWLGFLKYKNNLPPLDLTSLGLGILLGFINFATIYFLVNALASNVLKPAILFPINNIGVLVLASLGSALLFNEKISKKNWFGLVLSIIAIALIML